MCCNPYDEKYFNTVTEKNETVFKIYKNILQKNGIVLKNLVICDIGCARGTFISDLFKDNICYGYDISKYSIEKCREKYPEYKDNFKVFNLNSESFDNAIKFDLVTLFDVIEHLDNFSNLRGFIKNNLRKGGYLVITTPNAFSLQRFILGLSRYTGELDTTHVFLFTPYTLDFLLRRSGLKKRVLFTPWVFHNNCDFITKRVLMGGQIFAIYEK
jgi:2-polyprenyl-3-methyl-5-hydroxy-6-metoxy-1,4-benzoquinol methylase